MLFSSRSIFIYLGFFPNLITTSAPCFSSRYNRPPKFYHHIVYILSNKSSDSLEKIINNFCSDSYFVGVCIYMIRYDPFLAIRTTTTTTTTTMYMISRVKRLRHGESINFSTQGYLV
jgi:hypothetical protein